MCLFLRSWYRLEPRAEVAQRDEVGNPLSCVDCYVLMEHLLNPIFEMNQQDVANYNSMIYGESSNPPLDLDTRVFNR